MATQKNISTYRDVFKRAFEIVKRNKFLWLFGFFAAFLGAGGEFEPLMRSYTNITETSSTVFGVQEMLRGGLLGTLYANIGDFFTNYPLQAFFFLLLVLVVAVVMIWLAIVSQAALFDGANKLSRRQKTSYGDALRVGNQHFGPILLINVVAKAIFYGLFVLIVMPLGAWFVLRNSAAAGVLFIFLSFFVFIPLSIIISFIIKYAIAYIVIEGKKGGEAVRLGWELFRKNWLVSIEMALIVLLIGVAAGIVILLAVGLVAIPFILVGVATVVLNSAPTFTATVVIGTIVAIVIAAVFGSAYVAYQYAAWTLLFQKLVEEKAQSKIVRLFNKIMPAKI